MPKWSPISRLLQLRITTCVMCVLAALTIGEFFFNYGTYDYQHIPREDIDKELFKEISPNLQLKKTKPDCTYKHVLESTKSINSWEVPKPDDTWMKGLVNGSYTPEDCNPLFSVAILVTYRNRQSQLNVLLPYLHNFLRKQNIHYKVYLIEQLDEKPWNKGLLYNIGAKQAFTDKFPCLILHDVDLLPLDESNLYACTKQPRHLSASVDKFRYVLLYDWLVGGVLAITADQYKTVNGFSNRYQGWGSEDDDFFGRISANKLSVVRFPRSMARYTMLRHQPAARNAQRYRIMRENAAQQRAPRDGLGALRYESARLKQYPQFTMVAVRL